MEQFNVGDNVVLKSGGPVMTVVEIDEENNNEVWCRWYEGKKFQSEHFPPASLRVAAESDSGIGIA